MVKGVRSKQDLYAAKQNSTGSIPWKSLMSGKAMVLFLFSSAMIILLGASARGEFVLFVVMLWKNWDQFYLLPKTENNDIQSDAFVDQNDSDLSSSGSSFDLTNSANASGNTLNDFLKDYCLQDLHYHVPAAMLVSYAVFIAVGGYLQWTYYIKRRDKPEEWKCQPNRFLTTENERHEFLLGCICLLFNSSISGIASTYIINGGSRSRVYFDIHEYGYIYFFISTIAYFMVQDGFSYYYHRMLHWPFLYRNFHKWHHRYHSPTAFSAVAMHPIESTVFQIFLLAPLFIFPVHFLGMMGSFYYLYYFGLIDHSGIDMDSIWPWQPPVRFHDDHHKYFHCNFGFNTTIFDRFHDTLRRKDRAYGENIFGGKGIPLKQE